MWLAMLTRVGEPYQDANKWLTINQKNSTSVDMRLEHRFLSKDELTYSCL